MLIGRGGWLRNLGTTPMIPSEGGLGRCEDAGPSSAPGRDTGDSGSDSSDPGEDPEEDPEKDPEEDTDRTETQSGV